MAITEETRHHLYQRLEQALGPEEAHTLMQHLPPVGWADVATKHDLDHLAREMKLRFEAVDRRFDVMDQRFNAIDQRFDAMERRFDATGAQFDDRLTAGLAQLEARLLTAFGDFKDQIHADNQRFQKQMIFVLITALITVLVTTVGGR